MNLKEDKNDISKQKFLFPEHLSPDSINSGIKTKKLFKGVFYLSRTNFLEASVNCEGLEQSVLVQGLESQNRAVDGDTVSRNINLIGSTLKNIGCDVICKIINYMYGRILKYP